MASAGLPFTTSQSTFTVACREYCSIKTSHPGLARVHHALNRHRRGGGPAVQVQLVLGGSVPAVDGRGTSALSAQQAERGKISFRS